MLARLPKTIVKQTALAMGYQITRIPAPVTSTAPEGLFEDDGTFPKVEVEKAPTRWDSHPMRFRVTNEAGVSFEEDILYSHVALFKFLKGDFKTVLDIGSGTGCVSRLLRHLGKEVTECERLQSEDYTGGTTEYHEYLDSKFPKKFDAIWCSQVLEHQRNIGVFLNKIFDDLADDGVLALAVPQQIDSNLCFGHCNMFTPLILIYHLVCAGFDCREIRLMNYMNDISVLLRKRYNGIDRQKPMASLPAIEGRMPEGDELFENMIKSFPPTVKIDSVTTPHGIERTPWGYPPR